MVETMRLDRYLWWVRLAASRAVAQGMAQDGHLRLDGRPVDRAHAAVRIGNVLTFAAYGRVRVVRVTEMPTRRGPAAEAQGCYDDLSDAPVHAPPGAQPCANVSQQAPID